MFRTKRIGVRERGLHFINGELVEVLQPGRHFMFGPQARGEIYVSSTRNGWLHHDQPDVIARSGLLSDNEAQVVDITDSQRALVWIDNRFDRIIGPGVHILWNTYRDVRVEVVSIDNVRFEHNALETIVKSGYAADFLEVFSVSEGHEGVYFLNGSFVEVLPPGRYAFWRGAGNIKLFHKDRRVQILDITGQEIMTADKVTLRINGVVAYNVSDALKAVTVVDDVSQALYRDAQLALRAAIGTRTLDQLLSEKEDVGDELRSALADSTASYGVNVSAVGIRDVILPGEMKELLNRVIEAQKAAEANLIARREEVAAMRSQANTAKMLADNPTLMRLRELEILEKVIQNNNLQVVLGENGLTDKIVKLI